MPKTGTKETNAVLDNHLAAAQRGDLEAVLNDYSEDSVLFLPQGPVLGIAELREFFKAFLTTPPSGFPKAFELLRRDVDGEVAYIVWKAEPGVQLATDTFLERNRKIMVQTFAASLAAYPDSCLIGGPDPPSPPPRD